MALQNTMPKPSVISTCPAGKTISVTPSNGDQDFVLKSFSPQDMAGDVKVRNASDSSDVTLPSVQIGQRIDGFFSRIYSSGSTPTKFIGYYDP